ncbi:type IV pilus biogenesis/stability protein PilW [Methylomicrobium lacus]|uniref:type IV pilus biogenesis/stability protein PilW n=1 Tax=Methylomicrobium lacus TaxID=136992 RepID=UPI0035A83277
MTRIWLFCAALTLSACSWFDSKSPDRDAKQVSETYYQLGVRYLDLNKLEEAKENLSRAIDEDSDNAQAHNALAFLYEKLRQDDEAEDQYEIALSIKPDDFGTQNNLGRFWCEHGNPEKGLELLAKAGDNPLNERQWLALTNAGRCELILGHADRAETAFRKALDLNKTYAPALAEMQKVSYQKGDLWPAKAFLARYLSVAGHTPETLFIGYHTERALGNQAAAEEYRTLLGDIFPNSSEAKKIGSARK